MKNNIIITNKDSKLSLAKSKKLIGITNNILAKTASTNIPTDDSWMQKLWDWADKNNISSELIPREANKLLKLEKINLNNKALNIIPNEITYLKNLTFLELSNNNLTQLPSNIGSMENLNFLSISMNNITKIPESITKLKKLTNFWFPRNNLSLNENQLLWIEDLKINGCYIYS